MRKHFVDEQLDVRPAALIAGSVVERDLVRAHPRRDDPQRQMLGQASNHPKRLELVFEGESIAALDLESGGSVRGELADSRHGEIVELVLAALAEVAHRGVDAAAALRDFHVVEPLGPQLVLFEARPTEYRMGVRVDQTRSQHAAATIDDVGVGVSVLEIARSPDHRDATFADSDADILQDSCFAHLSAAAAAGRARTRYDLGCVNEEERGHRVSCRRWME